MLHARPALVVVLSFGILTARAQTGIAVPSMTSCDAAVQNLLTTYGVPGAAFALSRNGKLVYDRAFGNADLAHTEATEPHHLFRLASVSKPITGVAIMKLVQNGQLALSDHVFGPGGLLQNHPYLGAVTYTDTRLNNVTIDQLLHHTGGWDRDIPCFPNPTSPYTWQAGGCDPIGAPLYVAQMLGETNPVSKYALIRFLMQHGLDHDPGTTYAYSNIGFLTLGVVIEQVTGMTYEEYVESAVFAPLGICDAHLGRNLLADKLEREVEYKGEGYSAPTCYGTGGSVPTEYGGMNVEAMDAHGGWVATARELVKLMVAVDGFATVPDILNSGTITTMTTPSAQNVNYACGWQVNSFNNWWHTGSIQGTSTEIVRSGSGYTWAILLNKTLTNAQSSAFWSALDNLGWNCISATTSWPTHNLMAMPMNNASAVMATATGTATVDVSCTAGDGDGRIIVLRENSSAQHFPLDGTDYMGNAVFGSGDDLGGGNRVVYAGASTAVSVTGLAAGTTYSVSVFEYKRNAATGNNALYKLCGRDDVQVQMPVGIADHSTGTAAMSVRVSGDALVLDLPYALQGVGLVLLDATGRTLAQYAPVSAGQRIPIQGLAAGPLLVRFTRDGSIVGTQRVVLLR
ncbi:MAG: beta-lactamase family protein [Flavobacteriales bacterium]|nr:beta-lactamase family protein [Flavobacteriales bacterium]